MSTVLGGIQMQFFAYVQMRRLQTVRTGELVRAWGIAPQQERELLSRLAPQPDRAGSPRPVPCSPQLPPGGRWSPSESRH